MQLAGFECPNCGGNELVPGQDGELTCSYCDTTFGQVTRICPGCGHYNDAGVRHCAVCGSPVVRDCPACGTDNWALADHCVQCGRNLDLIERMALRWQRTTAQRLEERRGGMAQLKEREERASQERMAVLLEIERERQEALAQAQALQRQRERQLYVVLVVAAAVFVLIVAVTLLLTATGG